MHFRYGINDSGQRVTLERSGQRAKCELCGGALIGRCGSIVGWHWAHMNSQNCDSWAEGLTQWHIAWQKYLADHKDARIEVPIARNGVIHRADAVLPADRIFEIQHSAIPPKEIEKREEFYGERLVWIIDARDAFAKKRFELRKKTERGHTFRWKHPRKSINFAKRKIILDLGDGCIFLLRKIYFDTCCAGIGKLYYLPELKVYEMKGEELPR